MSNENKQQTPQQKEEERRKRNDRDLEQAQQSIITATVINSIL